MDFGRRHLAVRAWRRDARSWLGPDMGQGIRGARWAVRALPGGRDLARRCERRHRGWRHLPRATGAVLDSRLLSIPVSVAGSIGAVLLARSIEPYVALAWGGLYLVVPITAAALLNLSLFDFARRPGGLLYILAYVVVGAVLAAVIVYLRRHPEGFIAPRAGQRARSLPD